MRVSPRCSSLPRSSAGPRQVLIRWAETIKSLWQNYRLFPQRIHWAFWHLMGSQWASWGLMAPTDRYLMMWPLLQLDPVDQGLPYGPTLWIRQLPSGPPKRVSRAGWAVTSVGVYGCQKAARFYSWTLWITTLTLRVRHRPSGSAPIEPQGRGWLILQQSPNWSPFDNSIVRLPANPPPAR